MTTEGHEPDVRRAERATNRDPRSVRTRSRLVTAMREAVEEPGAELSVSAIAARARVNRGSFYAHFAGVEDLAVEALTDVFLAVASLDAAARRDHTEPARETSRRSLVEVVEFIGARGDIYRPLLGEGRNAFYAAIEDAFTERTLDTLRRLPGLPPGTDIETTARFVAAGSVGVIAWWLRDPGRCSAERLGLRLAEVLPPWFTTDPATRSTPWES
ncbi:TetR/AcrR family transcriptional regulator [Actinoplanes sp. NPDC000266]